MTKKEKVAFTMKTLQDLYPKIPIPLDHKDPYTLLIAVLLSAQSTDVRVNKITPLLFERADTPQEMIKLTVEEIREIIKPVGLSPMKSKGIHGLSHILLDKHDGKVPQDFESLEALPAVGHKTAGVVMAQAFGVPAFPVDTHIHRLLYRWGFPKEPMWFKQNEMQKDYFQKNFGMIYTCKLFGMEENIRLHVDGKLNRIL